MSYSVKEIFLTLQGEGAQAGIAAVFLRFAGCNLWSGLERDRSNAICKFCDTDFIGTNGVNGAKFATAQDLVCAVDAQWPKPKPGMLTPNGRVQKWVVCTGGEPLLQLDSAAIAALHAAGFKIAVETNGTVKAPRGIDWLCVSPKAGAQLQQISGDEIKLVYPQLENCPEDFADLDFKVFSLQPRDDTFLIGAGLMSDEETSVKKNAAHQSAAIEYCLNNPQWRISLQTHKIMGID